MSVHDLLQRLRDRGIHLEIRGETLHFRARKGALDDELRGALQQHRDELVRVLVATTTPTILTTDEIASFKALKVAVKMRAPWCREFWLVPERTNQGRLEMTVDEAVTLVRLMDAFPGSVIESFRRPSALPERREDWPEEWRDAWEERAAIMEFSAHLPRDVAEREAEVCVRQEYARQVALDGPAEEKDR